MNFKNMVDMKKLNLREIIESIPDTYSTNQLAFLASTSKAENTLRDALAYSMHLNLQENNSVLIEELNRTDVVVFDKIESIVNYKDYLKHFRKLPPKVLIECKAHSGIDIPDFLIDRKKDIPMAKDILGMYEKANEETDMYFIFFNNIYDIQKVPLTHGDINFLNKYDRSVLTNIHLSYKKKVENVISNWNQVLNELNFSLELTSSIVEMKAGMYYNIPVSILAFIYGPFKMKNVIVKPGSTYNNLDLVAIQ